MSPRPLDPGRARCHREGCDGTFPTDSDSWRKASAYCSWLCRTVDGSLYSLERESRKNRFDGLDDRYTELWTQLVGISDLVTEYRRSHDAMRRHRTHLRRTEEGHSQ